MGPDEAVDLDLGELVEMGGADQDPPAVGRQELGGGAEGQPEDAGVDEGQQLLGPESGRAGDQAGKTAVHVDLEVDV